MDDEKPRRRSHAADVAIKLGAVRGRSDTRRRRVPMLLELVHLRTGGGGGERFISRNEEVAQLFEFAPKAINWRANNMASSSGLTAESHAPSFCVEVRHIAQVTTAA